MSGNSKGQGKATPITGLDKPLGLQDVEALRFLDSRLLMSVSCLIQGNVRNLSERGRKVKEPPDCYVTIREMGDSILLGRYAASNC